MKSLQKILPALGLCISLAACGGGDTSTTTSSDTTINAAATDNAAADNTGVGMPGAATEAEANTNEQSGNMNGSAAGTSDGKTPPAPATSEVRTNGRNNAGTRSRAVDSIRK